MIDKNLPIGIKVKCKSYVKKSGCHFVVYNKDVTESENNYIASLPLFDIVEKEYEGIYVGTTFKSTSLTAEYMDDTYHQWWQFRRENGKQFAIVYYANNRKRLVPIEDCEVLI